MIMLHLEFQYLCIVTFFRVVQFPHILFSSLQIYLRAEDRGIPALTATTLVPVFINVFRNNNPPRFVNTPYATTISRDSQPNSNVYQVSAVDNDNVIGFNSGIKFM